ncbi:MAG: hypothetical protein KGP10_05055 [Actinomycetales bacterium]|nr:hypothetical protein [Actinomycetales bacterium]
MTTPRMKVLYLPMTQLDPRWQQEVISAVGPHHDLRIYDPTAPLEPQFADVDVVLDTGGTVGTRQMVDAATRVRLWQILGTGLDHFDMDYWRSKGVPVANCPGPMSAIALAEHALMFILMLYRGFPASQQTLQSGGFGNPLGRELPGQVLCVVGFGASAQELAMRAHALGMRVIGTDLREISPAEAMRWGAERIVPPAELDSLLPEADVVSLHLHLTDETRHTLDARRIALMKRGSFIVNVARGALVDEGAMVAAITSGHVGGAGLDVFSEEPVPLDSPLLTTPGIIATPHVSGGTDGTARRRAAGGAENIDRIARGLPPRYRVDQ